MLNLPLETDKHPAAHSILARRSFISRYCGFDKCTVFGYFVSHAEYTSGNSFLINAFITRFIKWRGDVGCMSKGDYIYYINIL